MARPRKPTAQLELVGAFKRHPERRRDSEPVCDEPVIQPPVLSKNGKEAWKFLVDNAVPGVLTAMDSAYLSLCAEALAEAWHGENVTIAARNVAGQMLGKLGMNPSARSSVIVAKKEKASRVSGLARKA